MKLKICTVHYCGLSSATRQSIEALRGKIDFFHVMAEATYIGQGRNTAILNGPNSRVKPALEPQYTHYLMLDSDIGFTPEQLEILIKRDLPIVSGAYESRSNPGRAVAGGWKIVAGNIDEGIVLNETGLKEVRWCGAGFLLLKREVLETLEFPWFYHEDIRYSDYGVQHCVQAGEDVSFCLKAARAGYKIFVDFDCKVQHIINKQEAYNMQEAQQQARTITPERWGLDMQSRFSDGIRWAVEQMVRLIDEINNLQSEIAKKDTEISELKKQIEGQKTAQ